MDKLNKNLYVQVNYHLYRHNVGDDFDLVKNLCAEFGFEFTPSFAYFAGLDKTMDILDSSPVSVEDQKVHENLLVSMQERLLLAEPYRGQDCHLRSNTITIDWDGAVLICCAAYTTKIAEEFNELSHGEIQAMRYQSPLCHKCISTGWSLVYLEQPDDKISALGYETISQIKAAIS